MKEKERVGVLGIFYGSGLELSFIDVYWLEFRFMFYLREERGLVEWMIRRGSMFIRYFISVCYIIRRGMNFFSTFDYGGLDIWLNIRKGME